MTLLSTKAEYVSLSELTAEIMFVCQVLEFLGVKVRYPIHVNINNVGAIFLSNNENAGQKTKHIDIQYHYV